MEQEEKNIISDWLNENGNLIINKMVSLKLKLQSLPFAKDILTKGGMIYAVGGIVRDVFLNKVSKDFDIMVTNIPYDILIKILNEYGKVDLVGESFGIIKFKEFGSEEDVDISLPRKETATGERGHKAFEVTTDPFLPIVEDLKRRDFTMNSIAFSINGVITDPFDGLIDIDKKLIHYTNAEAFFEDPLRMLRAVQFASRFDFTISPLTMKLIQENVNRIKEIAPERILIELEKIPSKGDPYVGFKLLVETGLLQQIFGELHEGFDSEETQFKLKQVRTIGEFIYVINKRVIGSDFASEVWKKKFVH